MISIGAICTMCNKIIDIDEEVRLFSCGHQYHQNCIKRIQTEECHLCGKNFNSKRLAPTHEITLRTDDIALDVRNDIIVYDRRTQRLRLLTVISVFLVGGSILSIGVGAAIRLAHL